MNPNHTRRAAFLVALVLTLHTIAPVFAQGITPSAPGKTYFFVLPTATAQEVHTPAPAGKHWFTARPAASSAARPQASNTPVLVPGRTYYTAGASPAGGNPAVPPGKTPGLILSRTASQTVVRDGVRVVKVEVGAEGFLPRRIELKAGVPVRLVFTRTEKSTCLEHVQIPAFGIVRTRLPLNEPVAIEFTPTEKGEFTFACGMGMTEGTLLVKS